jgi:hypothetical protein
VTSTAAAEATTEAVTAAVALLVAFGERLPSPSSKAELDLLALTVSRDTVPLAARDEAGLLVNCARVERILLPVVDKEEDTTVSAADALLSSPTFDVDT